MTTPDAHANFAYSTVATAPSPATSGTSLVVAAGQGALFPTPPFNATVWPVNAQPTTANAEIVRVTNTATDTFTITRAQEGSSARTVIVGDQIAATITVKTLTDVQTLTVGGDLTGTLPNPTLANAGPGATGPIGSATVIPIVTIDAKGRTTALSSAANAAIKASPFLLQSSVSGLLAENFPRWAISSNTALLGSARLSSSAIPVYNGTVITSVSWQAGNTAPSALSNWWFALTDSSFNVIRQSIDKLATAWTGASTHQTLAVDSIPVTAGSRSGTATVTLTFPTLSQSLTSLIAAGDSVGVSNANVAAYNGTFTVATVSSTQLTYTSGGSATDSLVAPFPTVQLAAGKRTYTMPADGLLYAVIMVKGTVGTLGCFSGISAAEVGTLTPLIASSGNTSLTGTCPSPIQTATTGNVFGWAGLS